VSARRLQNMALEASPQNPSLRRANAMTGAYTPTQPSPLEGEGFARAC